MKHQLFFCAVAVFFSQAFGWNVAHAQSTITQWTFEGDTLDPAVGSGTAQNIGGTSSAFAVGNGGGRGWNTATYPAQSTASGTAGVSFAVNTTGFESISLSFDHRASGTASRWAQIDYSLDGGATWELNFWNNNGGLSPHDTFHSFNVDFSSIAAINENPDFAFRIVSIFSPNAFDQNASLTNIAPDTAYQRANAQSGPVGTGVGTGNYGTTGTWRFDNVTIVGTGAGNTVVNVAAGTQVDSTDFTGSVGLNKTGAGTAILTGNSDFTGGVNIQQGGISVAGIGNAGVSGPMGAGSQIVLGDTVTTGTLIYTGAGEQSDRSVTVATGGGIIEVQGAANLSVAGIDGTGNFTKTGNGTLTTNILALGSGLLAVPEGQLILDFTPASTNSVNVASGLSDFAGDIIMASSSRLNIVSTGTIQGGGKLIMQESDSAFSANGATMVLTMNNEIVLNPNELPDFTARIGATSGNQLLINNTISGNGSVRFSAGTSGGAGIILLNEQLTYTGSTEINNSFTGVVRLGVDDAIPVTSGITFGILDDTGSRGTLDLNGFDQTLAYIANGLSPARGIVNTGAGLSTLTLNQDIDTSFDGVIGVPSNTTNILDANDNIALVKNGSGVLTLLQTSNYSGGSVVNSGALIAGANDALGTGNVVVNSGARVEISPGVAIVNGIVLNGGVLNGAGRVGSIAGNGLVSPGLSPGILTAGSLDPDLGMDFAFELTFTAPDFQTPSNSLNDLLRLTEINPLGTGLTADNIVNVYFNVGLLDLGDSFQGGFYLDEETSFNSLINGAQYVHYVAGDGGGAHEFQGQFYYTLAEYNTLNSSDFAIIVNSLALEADFGFGSVQGGITEFAVIPEGRSSWLLILGVAFLLALRHAHRRSSPAG